MPNLRINVQQRSPNQVYLPGGTITGTLMLDVDEPKSYSLIKIELSGASNVRWTGNKTVYQSIVKYVDLTKILWNARQSAPDGKLAPGNYSWRFTFIVPPHLPSTFRGSVGRVRYSLIGTIVTGALKFNHVVEHPIPVQQIVKIIDSSLLQPVRREVQKTTCCLWCASGPIVMNVALQKTGFLLGESFQLRVSLENGSSRRVSLVAMIKQRVEYRVGQYTRRDKMVITTVRRRGIESGESKDWEPTVDIPKLGVTLMENCRNIKISHSLDVICQVPFGLNLKVSIPIKLANLGNNQTRPDNLQQVVNAVLTNLVRRAIVEARVAQRTKQNDNLKNDMEPQPEPQPEPQTLNDK